MSCDVERDGRMPPRVERRASRRRSTITRNADHEERKNAGSRWLPARRKNAGSWRLPALAPWQGTVSQPLSLPGCSRKGHPMPKKDRLHVDVTVTISWSTTPWSPTTSTASAPRNTSAPRPLTAVVGECNELAKELQALARPDRRQAPPSKCPHD